MTISAGVDVYPHAERPPTTWYGRASDDNQVIFFYVWLLDTPLMTRA